MGVGFGVGVREEFGGFVEVGKVGWVFLLVVVGVGVFPVTFWRDATRAVFERVRGSSIGHRRLGARVSAEHTRYRIQQKETLKKHFPKKTIYFVTVQLW